MYKNVKYCKQDIDQTDLHNIVAETDGPVSRCALCAQLLASGLAESTRTMSEYETIFVDSQFARKWSKLSTISDP